MQATAEVPADAASFGRRLVEVLLLVVIPIALPWSWAVGVLLLVTRRPTGWLTTLAISPLGFLGPLWFYVHGAIHQYERWVAWPCAAALFAGCLAAMWRILQETA